MQKIEIACFNAESALIAEQGGADRVELCANIKEGGTTPDVEVFKQVRRQLDIDLYVMIRPRGGNFVYTEKEFQQMEKDIRQFRKLGANGFVFGILNADRTINFQQNSQLVELAKPLPCTFHRAFDEVEDIFPSLETVIQCGFSTLLTSGAMPNVIEGISVLKKMVERANNRICIMPGGGLRSHNIKMLQHQTNAGFFHSSAITGGGETANIDEVKALKSSLL